MKLPRLLVATTNQGKLKEYRRLLEGVPFDIIGPADLGIAAEVAETGATFEENAILKATTLCAASGLPTLADDSGLEVDALEGEPGVRSARYAGDDATDAQRIKFLLKKLKKVPPGYRTARFRCVIAIAMPGGKVDIFNGECGGEIALAPKGEHGFGYDPVFFVPELNKTMAELPLEIKNQLSHRARAAARAKVFLEKLGTGDEPEEPAFD
jgi:XTP/dITP diphosphohydrolase